MSGKRVAAGAAREPFGRRPAGSLERLLADAARRLSRARVGEPRREAVRILADLAGETPGGILLRANRVADPALRERFAEALDRRSAGEPLPYVTGVTGFRYLTLGCDRRALIPRPETEGVVQLLLARARSGVVADLGTGGGCLALSLRQEGNFARVLGVDCAAEALELARENSERLALRVTWIRGDWTSGLAHESLDAVVANPPYVSDSEYAALDPAVRMWEPAEALRAGPDGLVAMRRVLDDGRRVLRPGGWLVMELAASRAWAVGRLASELGWTQVGIHEDLYGRARYLLARRRGPE